MIRSPWERSFEERRILSFPITSFSATGSQLENHGENGAKLKHEEHPAQNVRLVASLGGLSDSISGLFLPVLGL